MYKLTTVVLITLLALMTLPARAEDRSPGAWTRLAPSVPGEKGADARPRPSQVWRLDGSVLDAALAAAPPERQPSAEEVAAEILIPTPGGRLERFAVVESAVMHPQLRRWLARQGWPMRTYRGRSLDRPATAVRLDWGGPAGFHAMVSGPDGSYFVDPEWQVAPEWQVDSGRPERDLYLSRSGKATTAPAFRCEGPDFHGLDPKPRRPTAKAGLSTHGNLRTYRTAVAATGEYTTNLSDGTQAGAQADVVTVVNRVNLIFERELSVRFVLVANNQDVIYTDGAADPYTNGSSFTMLGENTANLNAVIGSANYDVGHVLGDGGSGAATVEGPCGSNKARGASNVWSATGDAVVVNMIAHEIGHQFGARHTFNSPLGACSGNRTASTAWEPGSGTTIMSYSGTCGSDDVQANSDDYFHAGSLDAMLNFVGGAGNFGSGACAALVPAGNAAAPVVTPTGNSYTIPANTPFLLSASGSDDDGDALTYTWEQFDLGAAATLAEGDNGDNPIVRSLLPGDSPTRYVVGTMLGETLPSTDRTLTFRVTARDNNPGGGRVAEDVENEDTVTLTSDTSVGPFRLTSPNGGESYAADSTVLVTWDVAGTAGGAVQALTVDVLLSEDGGASFPVVLLTGTPNDGSQSVTFPGGLSVPNAVLMVRASENVFFDVSDAAFSVGSVTRCASPGTPLSYPGLSDDLVVSGTGSSIADLNVTLDVTREWIGGLTVRLEHLASGTTVTLLDEPGKPEITNFGCPGDDILATLDDEAAFPAHLQCVGDPAMSGTLWPRESLSAFDGLAIDGTWRLSVDYLYGGPLGALNQWCVGAAVVSDTIFADGFESGSTSSWSLSLGVI